MQLADWISSGERSQSGGGALRRFTKFFAVLALLGLIVIVFFSSRRRHTRYWRDWSSDVCSSDLHLPAARGPAHRRARRPARALPGGGIVQLALRLAGAPPARARHRRLGLQGRAP